MLYKGVRISLDELFARSKKEYILFSLFIFRVNTDKKNLPQI